MNAKPTYEELLEMLDNVSATAENMYLQLAKANLHTADDARSRQRTILEARALCDRLLRPEGSDGED